MYQVKEMHQGEIYLIQGQSSANSLAFEDKAEIIKFQQMCNRILSPYFKLKEYLFTPDGWQLVVRVRSKETIIKHYKLGREKLGHETTSIPDLWRILSEKIRILRSNYIVWSNKKEGRTGSKVSKSYERFIFESIDEARTYIKKMRNNEIDLSQKKERYKADKTQFNQDGLIITGDSILTSKNVQENGFSVKLIGLKQLDVWDIMSLVVCRLIDKTIVMYNNRYKQKKPSFIPF